jgi:hypothetical protein
MSQPIATLDLIGMTADAPAFSVRVNIFAPVLHETPSTYVCTVEVQPIYASPFNIYGEGSLQALSLGAKLALQILVTFVEQGGNITYLGGGEFAPEVYGFHLPGNVKE